MREQVAAREIMNQIMVSGIPREVDDGAAVRWIEQAQMMTLELLRNARPRDLHIEITWPNPLLRGQTDPRPQRQALPVAPSQSEGIKRVGADVDARSALFKAKDPRFSIDRLVIPESTRAQLEDALALLRLEPLVFDQWGLRAIEPFPKAALNFHGPPGTGKTLAAHCVAKQVGKKILSVSFAELESKFPGDGQKNLRALFQAANRDDAVLLVDEAETLLSKRISNVSQGAEHSMNAMRSELILALEDFHGIVIFATNLFGSYDPAFTSRLRNIEFKLPDEMARKQIWQRHLPARLPTVGVSVDKLSLIEQVSGRDIKAAVIQAAVRKARLNIYQITHQDLETAIHGIVSARQPTKNLSVLSESERAEVANVLKIGKAEVQSSMERGAANGSIAQS